MVGRGGWGVVGAGLPALICAGTACCTVEAGGGLTAPTSASWGVVGAGLRPPVLTCASVADAGSAVRGAGATAIRVTCAAQHRRGKPHRQPGGQAGVSAVADANLARTWRAGAGMAGSSRGSPRSPPARARG